jgi:eukaryotic-like serine/threonine-protein kinase
MPDLVDCPELGSWPALFGNSATPKQREAYERHLETCPACQERLDRADLCGEAMRTLIRRVANAAPAPGKSAEDALLSRLREVRSPLAATPVEAADLYFLQPASRPDIFGMLGPYEVEEVIGHGGMGVVLKAFEPALHRLVAIKVMAAAVAGSAVARQRFTREAKAAAAVSHDHIVTVHGVNETAGLPYLVMQYVPGESLQARLDRGGPLEVTEIVRIGLQTASGLAAAHAQGLIHRDIKPANLLLENGLARVRITDFGLARMADDTHLTQQGVLAGTPEYMAPEQARGEKVDHRADLFSLGSVLYAMCTGVPPFRGSSTVAVLRQVSDQAPPLIRELNPDIPSWLETFIARLMAKNPAERFQSAAEVAALLEGYLAYLRQPVTITAPPTFETRTPADSRSSRWKRLVLLLCLGGVLIAGVSAFAFTHGGGWPNPQAMTTNDAAVTVRKFKGHAGPVHNVRFTADGQRLVSASGWPEGDRTVRVWTVATGDEVICITLPGEIHSLDLTPDGRHALAGLSTGEVVYLDLESGGIVHQHKIHQQAVGWVGFAPGGKRVFSTSDDGNALLWDLATGHMLKRFHVLSNKARGGILLPDSQRLLTGDSEGGLQIWDVSTGQEVKRLHLEGPWMIDGLGVTADGRQALVAGIAGVRVHDLETGKQIHHFQAGTEEVHQADLSQDGRWLLTGSFDGQVRLWNFQTEELLQTLGTHDGMVFSVAFSPDGRYAASGGGGERKEDRFVAGSDHDIRVYDLKALTPDSAAAPTTTAAPQAAKSGWPLTVGSLVCVAALSLLALSSVGAWYFVRRHRRAAMTTLVPASVQDNQTEQVVAQVPIAFACSACGKSLKARAELAGKKVKCLQCDKPVLVPSFKMNDASGPS